MEVWKSNPLAVVFVVLLLLVLTSVRVQAGTEPLRRGPEPQFLPVEPKPGKALPPANWRSWGGRSPRPCPGTKNVYGTDCELLWLHEAGKGAS